MLICLYACDRSGVSSGSTISGVSGVSYVSEINLMNDTVKPKLRIFAKESSVRIAVGEEYDLMSGIYGIDNLEGNITDKVQIDIGGYDPNIPGVYKITYTLSDSAGNEAKSVTRKMTVYDASILTAPPIYTDTIEGEILNPENPAVYGGAWYHKAVSSKDAWVGIESTVTLPEVSIRRYKGEYDSSLAVDPDTVNLDNPSIYLGGNALNESDVGLSYSRALVDIDGQILSKGCIAFRPFWRYITYTDKDEGGYDVHDGEYAVSASGSNCIANYHWHCTEYYYLPGDKLRIIIYIPEAEKMQLQIEVVEKSTLPSSVAMREKYGWNDPADFKSPVFSSPGHGTGIKAEYKRVNAIDQVANEGGTAIVTQSEVTGAIWHETYLYRIIDGTLYRVPMSKERCGVRNAPDDSHFTVTYEGVDRDSGGEIVSIHPGYTK